MKNRNKRLQELEYKLIGTDTVVIIKWDKNLFGSSNGIFSTEAKVKASYADNVKFQSIQVIWR